MQSIAVHGGRAPHSSHSAGSFDDFWEYVEPRDILGVYLGSCGDPSNLLVVALVGVFLGDHDVEVQEIQGKGVH